MGDGPPPLEPVAVEAERGPAGEEYPVDAQESDLEQQLHRLANDTGFVV